MVTVALAAQKFIDVLSDKVVQLRASPPSKPSLRQILLDWCAQIPIVQVREYILADFNTHLDNLYDIMTQPEVLSPNNNDNTNNTIVQDHLSVETIPYLSFSPQPSTYVHFLQDITNNLIPNEYNGEVFWAALHTILSPIPSTYSRQDLLLLLEVQFNSLFETIIRYVPTVVLYGKQTNTSASIQNRLSGLSQLIIPHILTFFDHLPRGHLEPRHTSTLAKAILTLCVIIQPNNTNNDGNNNNNVCVWLDSLLQALKLANNSVDLSYIIVDLLVLFNQFILIPSLFSQALNFDLNNHYSNNLQDIKFTLLSQNDYETFQDVVMFSPVILDRLVPYITHLLPLLSPQNGSYPAIFTSGRLVGGLLFIFSMFSHIGTVLRYYNTTEFAQFINIVQFKTNMIQMAKLLQTTTSMCESIMLPMDLQRTSVQMVQILHTTDMRRIRKQAITEKKNRKKQEKLAQKKIAQAKLEQSVSKTDQVGDVVDDDDDDGDDDEDDKATQDAAEVDNPTGLPLLEEFNTPIISTIKDFFANDRLKTLLYPTSNIPFTRGQELNIAFLQKVGGVIYGTDDFAALATIVGGKAKDLRVQKKKEAMETKRKQLELQKKQRYLHNKARQIKIGSIIKLKGSATDEDKIMSVKITKDMTEEEKVAILAEKLRIVQMRKKRARKNRELAASKPIQDKKIARRDAIQNHISRLGAELSDSKSNPLTGLLSELVLAGTDSDDDNDDVNEENKLDIGDDLDDDDDDDDDGNTVSFEDEAYGDLTSSLLSTLRANNRQNDGEDDDDDDFGTAKAKNNNDNVNFGAQISSLVSNELFTFNMNNQDDDDFGQVDIL